jgi:hypothetical protein
MNKHTPGPWKQDTLGRTTVWAPGAGKNAVAVCQGLERDENIANARLIAAAPELYAALRDALDALKTGTAESAAAVLIDAGRAALAKVEGA